VEGFELPKQTEFDDGSRNPAWNRVALWPEAVLWCPRSRLARRRCESRLCREWSTNLHRGCVGDNAADFSGAAFCRGLTLGATRGFCHKPTLGARLWVIG